MTQDIKEKVDAWLSSNVDDETKKSINELVSENGSKLVDSFYKDLEFGTGGLRGIMGVGSNRMNKYTVGMATQGLCNYLKKTYPDEPIKVAIAHDNRNNSSFFAEITANVFSANGIHVYLFDELRPTPELSFAIRELNCKSGVVVTASHNPKEYNGYKAYWEDGAQLIPPHDKGVINEVKAIKSINDINFDKNDNHIEVLSEAIDKKYIDVIRELSLSEEAIRNQSDLKIVYSPIHGTGYKLVPRALKALGFKNVISVDAQNSPDGDFPTVVYPNPEEAEALSLALKKAEEHDAELIMATDPDADRVGIAIKNDNNEYQLLNGNQTGALLVYYLLDVWKKNNRLEGKEYVVKTIVTTELIQVIADDYGVKCYNTLTGFKYIAELIRKLEGKEKFIGGGEESYGYLIGDKVRDKDAIAACVMIAEMAAYFKDQGKSLFETLNDLYLKYGYYKESLRSLTKKGKQGAEEIEQIMKMFREDPPNELGGSKLVKILDYQSQEVRDLKNDNIDRLDFSKSNVLQFFTEEGSKISVRPSGTEPKIKFYFGVHMEVSSSGTLKATKEKADNKIQSIINDLGVFS